MYQWYYQKCGKHWRPFPKDINIEIEETYNEGICQALHINFCNMKCIVDFTCNIMRLSNKTSHKIKRMITHSLDDSII